MTGPRRFDIEASRAAAEEAIGRIDQSADPEFKRAALAVVHYVATTAQEFTTDRVWYFADDFGVIEPHDARALGPIMRRAQGQGWIEDTGRVHLSVRAEAHRNPKRVWRSTLYKRP